MFASIQNMFDNFPWLYNRLVMKKIIIYVLNFSNSIWLKMDAHSQSDSLSVILDITTTSLASIWIGRTSLVNICMVNLMELDIIFESVVINQILPAQHCKNGFRKLLRNPTNPV